MRKLIHSAIVVCSIVGSSVLVVALAERIAVGEPKPAAQLDLDPGTAPDWVMTNQEYWRRHEQLTNKFAAASIASGKFPADSPRAGINYAYKLATISMELHGMINEKKAAEAGVFAGARSGKSAELVGAEK